jgi:outer membrane protein assembly factor BamB
VFRFIVACFLSGAILSAAEPAPPTNDGRAWPTLSGDLQRSSFYPSFPDGPLKLAWRVELWRELVAPRAQVIVDGGRAFIGTGTGRLIALDAATGEMKWSVQTGGVISHSPAVGNGLVFCGSLDRTLRALDAQTGKEQWRFSTEEGISVSPVLWRNLVMCGDRAGNFFALHLDGTLAWKFRTGDRILCTASISADGDAVVFGSEDMHVYCLAVADGTLRWKSNKLPGLSVRDYAPVIAGDLVFVTTNPVKDFHTILTQHQEMLIGRTGFKGADPRYISGTADDVHAEQDAIEKFLRPHPDEQTFHALRMRDGQSAWIAPILYTGGLHNPPTPPCVNRATGEIFVQLRSAFGSWDGGGEVRPLTCFGRLDRTTGRVTLVEHSYLPKEPGRPPGARDVPWGTFAYIGDETQTLSCAPDRLFSNHQGNLGMLDLSTGRVTNLFGRRDSYAGFYGPANFGWEEKGGLEKAAAAHQPYGLVNEWHGPARSIASVADGRVYYNAGSQILCFISAKNPKR